MTQLLTHSRQDCFKTCRKKHWFMYEAGIRREVDAKALRMGSAYHAGLEYLGMGQPLDEAMYRIALHYECPPDSVEPYEWEIERETVMRLLCGYHWRWSNSGIDNIATEMEFQLPLLNPATGKATPSFNVAGKIDGIVSLEDGRLAVKESKLLGDDIGDHSDLWRRLRIDHQISMYVIAARRLGYQVEAVLYDVTRKPTIRPCEVPILDDDGIKIVVDRNGDRVKTNRGQWRQSPDREQGFVLMTRPMTVSEWGDRLTNDIYERPDFYYARREITRLDQDLDEYSRELWDIQLTLQEAKRSGRWYRTCNKNTCSWCEYFGLCTTGYTPGDTLPPGFQHVTNLHPELQGGTK